MSAPELALRAGPIRLPAGELQARAEALRVHPVVARLLAARGVEPERWAQVLCPRLADLRPPAGMAGFPEALDLIDRARRRGWRVGIFGDYDVDGVTTATILADYLERVGLPVITRVARRDRGYGFGEADAQALIEAGARLVLTGDCGTSDVPALEHLARAGVRTIVIDHHQVPERAPPADAFINPHQPGCAFPFKGLCSAGVAFYLCAALRRRILDGGGQAPDPRDLLDLVALGTVCDMVPMIEENRVLVRYGLQVLARRERPGIRALLAAAGVGPQDPIHDQTLGFALGPRLNAPGRLGPAEPALALLRARSEGEARALADRVEAINAQRRASSDQIREQAQAQARAAMASTPRPAALVLADPAWLPGIVGIVAGSLVEHWGVPVLLLARDPGTGEARGSARSVPGVDVRAALAECEPHLARFGGHREAAGVSLPWDQIPALRQAFVAAVARRAGSAGTPAWEHDGPLALRFMDDALVDALERLGPYGPGFPRPLFLIDGAWVTRVRVVGGQHLRLTLRQGKVEREAIAFRQADLGVRVGERVCALATPTWNHYRGRRTLQLRLERVWRGAAPA